MGSAKFTVNGQAFDSDPRGVDVADGALLTLALESTTDVRKWQVSLVKTTKNVAGDLPVFNPVSGVAATPGSNITAQLQAQGDGKAQTYLLRSVINNGKDASGVDVPEFTKERMVCVRTAGGLRAPLYLERDQYDAAYGWQPAIEDIANTASSSAVRTARLAADEWNPSLKGHDLLGWYRHDVNIVLASATEVGSWDDVRGLTGYGPQLTPPTAAHRPSQLVAGGPIVFRGEDSPLAYDGLDAACPAAWIGATELTIVLVATPDGTEGAHWGDPDWAVAHLLTVSNVPGTDGVSLLGNTEAYEASGLYAFQGLGIGQVQVLIAASGVGGKTVRQGALPAAVSATGMTALAASARLRLGFDQAGGGAFYPADMTVYELMVFRGRLNDADMRAIEDYVSRQAYGGVTEMRPCLDAIGDSLTAGQGASPNEMWPRRMARNMGSIAWNVQAVSGYTIPQMRALARGKRQLTVRERRTRHVASLWGGTNSISTGATAAATYAELTAAIDELLGVYGAVIVPTMLPRVDCTGGEETQRAAYNALILALDDVYPGRVYPVDLSQDVGLATVDGTAGYWHADDIHLLDPGYEAVADLVEPVMTAALAALEAA